MQKELNKLIPSLLEIACKAGKKILTFYKTDQLDVTQKSNATPLTRADIAAHTLIQTELKKLKDWPFLSEEGEIPNYEVRKNWDPYWLVDPLDGTRGFISGIDEFTVNIAVIKEHIPVLGVLYAPAYDKLFYAVKGSGAFIIDQGQALRRIHTSNRSVDELRFIVGKYHKLRRIQPIVDAVPKAELIRMNSSLKLAMIAEGKADVYIRLGPINEWDTGAGHCILEEAGGKIVDFKGESLQYNARKSLLWPPFMAVGNTAHLPLLFELFEKGTQE